MRNPMLLQTLKLVHSDIKNIAEDAHEESIANPFTHKQYTIDAPTLDLLFISLGEAINLLQKIEQNDDVNRIVTALEFDSIET